MPIPLSSATCQCGQPLDAITKNIRVQGLDFLPVPRVDNRRLEVVTDGLPLFHGALSVIRADGGQNSSKRQSSDARQLGCVFQDMTPPKSILRKSDDMPKPIQRVKYTKAIARHTKIRDQNPSLGCICPDAPHQRSPNAPKLEDRSREETEWQEQGAHEAA